MTVYSAKTFHGVFTAVDRDRITSRLLYDKIFVFDDKIFVFDVH